MQEDVILPELDHSTKSVCIASALSFSVFIYIKNILHLSHEWKINNLKTKLQNGMRLQQNVNYLYTHI